MQSLIVVIALTGAFLSGVVADKEIEDLTLQFQRGFDLVAAKTGNQNLVLPGGQFTIGIASQAIKDLYRTIEESILSARQQAAILRSTETLKAIEALRLS